jgi:hypothetical protein
MIFGHTDFSQERIQSYFDRISKGKDLMFEEAAEFYLVLVAIKTDDPSEFDIYKPIYADHLYVQAFHLISGPNKLVEEAVFQNFNLDDELEKRFFDFDNRYQSMSVNLVDRQIFKEYSVEVRQARENFSGPDLDIQIRMIKLKLEYVRIHAVGLFKDYLWEQSTQSLNISYGPIELIFDIVSLIHIINRHVIRNMNVGLQPLKGKSRLTLSNLEQIIDKIKYAFSVLPIELGVNDSSQLSFYFKNALNGEVYAIHTKTIRNSLGGSVTERQRVETFYPVTDAKKLSELQNRGIQRIRQDFYLYK